VAATVTSCPVKIYCVFIDQTLLSATFLSLLFDFFLPVPFFFSFFSAMGPASLVDFTERDFPWPAFFNS